MLRTVDSVKNILIQDTLALEAAQKGLLNLSAYANAIRPLVEELTLKEVKKTTIVTSLSRILKDIQSLPSIFPKVDIERVIVISPLFEFTIQKNDNSLAWIKDLYSQIHLSNTDFMTITQGVGEITAIASHSLKNLLVDNAKKAHVQITFEKENLVAMNIKFKAEYIDEPNIIFALLHKLAVKKINVIEIVSTYTELTIIIEGKDMNTAFKTLSN